ncbi:hypothetical protein PCASD_23484 [Puccinia coronata f. sp. avenae]|uniref:Uncharacterized protein n=1 Tax=Puccinia coronata f. sp. avenae TaxID=200324 RepID=A0A2N5SZF7_9BASI|nr:hypothetical protein PCASD_23484 [Puccinia coronata f. sp. avenae]
MGAHLRNRKDISRKEQLRAEIARQQQHPPRRGDVPIYYEISESTIKQSRLLQQRSFDRAISSSIGPRAGHGTGQSAQSEQHTATQHGSQPFIDQLPGSFPSYRIKPLDLSPRSDRATRSVKQSTPHAYNGQASVLHPSEDLLPPRLSPSNQSHERGNGDHDEYNRRPMGSLPERAQPQRHQPHENDALPGPLQSIALTTSGSTAGINRSNTAVQAVLEQSCSTGGRTGTVQPKHLPPGWTGLSNQFLGPVAQDQPGPVGQICPTSWLLLWSDSACPTTSRTQLFKHRSNYRVQPVNAGSVGYKEMLRLSHNWNAKEDLTKLEKAIETKAKNPFAPMVLDQDKTNAPLPSQEEDITYLKQIPGGSNMPNAYLPPPMPQNQPPSKDHPTTSLPQGSSPQFAQGQDNSSPLSTQNQNANNIPSHHLGYPPTYDQYYQYQNGPNHRYQNEQNYLCQDSPQNHSGYQGHRHNHPYQRPNQSCWRG